MASVPKLVLLALLCSCYHSLVAHARDARSNKVLDIESMKPKSVCSKPKAVPSSANGTTVRLHHRHGPCSPTSSKNKAPPTLEETLQRDQLRAAYIQRKLSRASSGVQQSNVTVPTTLGTSLNTGEYVITVGLGSQAATQRMLIDTGSDVSWVQCKPCPQCHDQADALFDPAASTTYSAFSCSSAACAQLHQPGCSNSQCQYSVTYGDRSTTTGTYSSDTLTLGSDDVVESFQFGCSHVESGFDDDLSDGLMGLGGGTQSLVSQTAGTFGNAFSYCLPPTASSAGFLTLGAGPSSGSGFVTTPMLRSRQVPTFYAVALQAITVGGRQLNVPSSVFSGGTVVDSGTVVTRLPPTAYKALSAAFKAGMKQYKPAPARPLLDTCFDFSGQTTISVPPVSLVFAGGAVVDLDVSGILLENCLAFTANDDDGSFGIIGNVQQRTFEVLYDVGGGSFGFRAGAC
ncbi:hypothetical protein PR202_gb09591 [Eleusine coracana subsp. coracana]|uniref:Peptidase A1 domain-containing protein n=1 Tax=Eleusine coracana subsp. coracana TaxID=191504 RepID=A0AAV5EIF1_ELECO|nr:hypothetical protein QOZ80_2BG0199080 [Eleusine coracana subsp. coracana]GJN22060.1 hypothetical protein PR202_gb09591 [Eleusine coracana subsp. coracana]